MKNIFLFLTLVSLILTACAPAITTGSQPENLQPTTGWTVAQPETATGMRPTQTTVDRTAGTEAPRTAQKQKSNGPAQAAALGNPNFIATEILGRPTSDSVTANVVTAVAMEISYEYGNAPGTYTGRTIPQSATAGVPVETWIDGLQPNTHYYYRLLANGEPGPEHTFTTQRAPGSSFVFAIQGDSHPERDGRQFDAGLYTHTLQSAAADHPDFYLTSGDDFSVDALKTVTVETVRELYTNQRQWLGLVGAPVFLVNGNHEQAAQANLDGTPDNVAVWAQTARNSYFPQPAPDDFYSGDAEQVEHIGLLRDYYAFTWGDALFVVIDPYWHSPQTVDNTFGAGHEDKKKRDLWNVTLGESQYQWLKQTLETSAAKYKFVFAHHVNGTGRGGIELASSYEWGDTAHLAVHRPGWQQTIHQLMVENHVTIFFQGHDHIFVHQELDGVIYQTLPEPANPNETYENDNAYKSGEKFPNSGHVRVSVSPESVKVDYIRSYLDRPDELAYSYTVE